MKKLSVFFVAVSVIFTCFSCGRKFATTANLTNELDSLNYALGVFSGTQIRKGMMPAEDTTKANLNAVLIGFSKGFKLLPETDISNNMAITAGIQLSDGVKTGFLFGDSTLKANRGLIISTAEKIVRGDSSLGNFNVTTAQQYYFKTLGMRKDTVPQELTKEVLDTLSMVYAVMQCSNFPINDSTKKDDFVKNLKKGFDVKRATAKYENLGLTFANGNYEYWEKGIMGDSTLKLNSEIMLTGVNAGVLADTSIFTFDSARAFLMAFQEKVEVRKAETEFGENRIAGEKFLEDNAKRTGIKITESGLQYEVIKEGKGVKPVDTDHVKVHYSGTLLDGTEFDSSYARNEPAVFGLRQVIKGWTEGLQLMPVGSKYKFYVPQDLAYGIKGSKDRMTGTYNIPPFSALIFEVELLKIEEAKPQSPQQSIQIK
jgi:FKBP-type peptidyl-prolyl cis-trans isomerase